MTKIKAGIIGRYVSRAVCVGLIAVVLTFGVGLAKANIADISNDGIVNLKDYAILANDWLKIDPNLPGDISEDGIVGPDDLYILGINWLWKEIVEPTCGSAYSNDCGPANRGDILSDAAHAKGGNDNSTWIGGALETSDMHVYVYFDDKTIDDTDESIELTLKYWAGNGVGGLDTSNSTANAFRVGLMNNHNSTVGDNSGISNTAFADYTGYYIGYGVQSSNDPEIFQRNTSQDNLILGTNTSIGSGTQADDMDGAEYRTLTFKVTKTTSGISINSTHGTTGSFDFTVNDDTSPETTYNTIVIGIDDTPELLDWFYIDDIEIEHCEIIDDAPQKPNIVLILADDLGYGSTVAYGADPFIFQTPAIDSLAQNGRLFTNAYTPSSVCSPTRYGLLTGQYQWREGRQYGVEFANSKLCINRSTISSRLDALGYNTAQVGKWHLGYQDVDKNPNIKYNEQLTPGPLDLGFDYHWGIPTNHGDTTGVWVENDWVWRLNDDLEPNEVAPPVNWQGYSIYDIPAPFRHDDTVVVICNDHMDTWIDAQSSATPFFLYYAAPAVHVPLTPSTNYNDVSNGGPYTDWIMELDGSVASILDALDRNGFTDNTIVIFTSDNGGHTSGASEAVEAGLKINGDYKGLKLSIWDGGFRVPMIIKWPGYIDPGTTSDELVNLVDIYATIMELTGQTMQSPSVEAPDSHSFYDALFGTPSEPIRDNMIYTSYEGIVAIQSGNWKYIEGIVLDPDGLLPFRSDEEGAKLYDISTDPYETNNIISSNPTKASELQSLLETLRSQGYSR